VDVVDALPVIVGGDGEAIMGLEAGLLGFSNPPKFCFRSCFFFEGPPPGAEDPEAEALEGLLGDEVDEEDFL
jgi:hypothetical protein